MAISLDLEDRIILIAGASRGGISGATARLVAEAGGTVVAVDLAKEILDETVADVEARGGSCHAVVADLTDVAQSEAIVPGVIERFGRLDGVANVAGGTKEHEWMPLDQTPTEIFRETLALNFEYVFRICRDAAREMIRLKIPGALVNVGSVSALTAAPWHGPYGAGKSAISALTRTMANEWQEFGIRANTVSPGAVMTQRLRDREQDENVTSDDVIFTEADELAQAIVFLLSDLASGISGQTLVVDRALSTRFCAGFQPKRTG